jgi:HTH-type transcriptional regulator/antitoxin HigA
MHRMAKLKYTIIKSKKQYNEYCKALEQLVSQKPRREMDQEIELLTLLIEKWDEEHNTFDNLDPIQLLKSLMDEHKLKSKDLVRILGVSKSLVSSILNYRRGLSKENIRVLADYFGLSQEAFNREYRLVPEMNKQHQKANLKKYQKGLKTSEFTMTSDQVKKKLNDIVDGIRDDIFKADRYYFLVKEIGIHSKTINKDPRNFGQLFGTLQKGMQGEFLIAISRIYDKSDDRNKTRSLQGLINFLEKHKFQLPKTLEVYQLKDQLSRAKINLDHVFGDDDTENINRRLLLWLKNDLIQTYESHRLLKTIRDKKLSHNETAEVLDSPTLTEILDLLELAKSFLGIIGWAYLGIAYKSRDRYILSSDASRPSIALRRLLTEMGLSSKIN